VSDGLGIPEAHIAQAARWVAEADALLVAAGAGMGVDSGLPDFRGNQGFWNAYPPYARLGLSFVQMANPAGFSRDAPFAWGFYGHRMHLYRDTLPHAGFDVLRGWGQRMREGTFVFTSNIDGAFQTAGFDDERVVECHGSLHWLQCQSPCHDGIWSAADTKVDVDMSTMRATGELPGCPRCGAVARPNVLMFGDWNWLSERTSAQQDAFRGWLNGLARDDKQLVIVECGAGTAVPSVRATSESLVRQLGAQLIRINPREPQVPSGQLGLPAGARITLEAIDHVIGAF